MSATRKAICNAIEKKFPINDATQRLINLASADLHYGPIYEADDGGEWPGFSTACQTIREALNVHTIYVDTDSEQATDSLPEGYEDENGEWVAPFLDTTYEVETAEVLSILVGKELAQYIR